MGSIRHLVACLVLSCLIPGRAAADLPDGVALTPVLGTQGANKLIRPVWFGEMPGQKGVFVAVEQGAYATDSGRVTLFVRNAQGDYAKTVFLGLKVRQGDEEMGLLGLAFHPKYAENRKYYVNYIPPKSGEADSTFIEERVADATGRKDSGAPPRRVLTIAQTHINHNGGTLNFGQDGYLYIGTGDDGISYGQDKKTLLASILRIDVDKPSGGNGYGIPSDNPFLSSTDAAIRKEIWAHGLRNPWKWSFDPLNQDLWVADVGHNRFEEVDIVRKGENMGWATLEGNTCINPPTGCSSAGTVPPIVVMPRDSAQCIIGGFVYRGNSASPFYGAYIFGDLLTKRIWAVTQKDRVMTEIRRIATSPANISSFGTDSDGNLYAVGYSNGIIYLLDHPQLKSSGGPTRSGSRRRSGPFFSVLDRSGDPAGLFPGLSPDRLQLGRLDGTGIVDFSVAASSSNTLSAMPAGLYILKAFSRGAERGMCRIFLQ